MKMLNKLMAIQQNFWRTTWHWPIFSFYKLWKHQKTLMFSKRGHPQVFLGKGVLKICSKFTGKQPCRSVISIELLCNFVEVTLWHGCSPVNLLHFFRTAFYKNIYGALLLCFHWVYKKNIGLNCSEETDPNPH